MSSLSDAAATLHLVIKDFPEHQKILETLYRQNELFHSLCEDFSDCVRAMEYWCGFQPARANSTALCDEYKTLCADLKKEIAKWLAEHKTRD